MKAKIDTKIFTMEGSPGVISIKNPDWNMTGEYTCAVQTFESTDKRSARLQIIGMCSVFVTFHVCVVVCMCVIGFYNSHAIRLLLFILPIHYTSWVY